MLLAIDIGNTNIVLGLFRDEHLVLQWRLSADTSRSVDEYRAILQTLATAAGLDLPAQTRALVLASVVPPLTTTFAALARQWLRIEPLIVHVGLRLGLNVRVREPARVGVDRLVNAVAGKTLYGSPCITLDLGTATKFDVVDARGDFIGGAIAPGLQTATEALVSRTALLPRIDFAAPPSPIGEDTVRAMQAGIVLGYLSLVEGLASRIRARLGSETVPLIATGGLAPLIVPHTRVIDIHDPDLTLKGLRIVHGLNAPSPPSDSQPPRNL
ncbi:MAG: type III pantothenate kinase [Caldilineae bacterium]|nr:MAG: type III pantothenate kinase [Caldilineae bacterium]